MTVFCSLALQTIVSFRLFVELGLPVLALRELSAGTWLPKTDLHRLAWTSQRC